VETQQRLEQEAAALQKRHDARLRWKDVQRPAFAAVIHELNSKLDQANLKLDLVEATSDYRPAIDSFSIRLSDKGRDTGNSFAIHVSALGVVQVAHVQLRDGGTLSARTVDPVDAENFKKLLLSFLDAAI